jgi:hypothetical protein
MWVLVYYELDLVIVGFVEFAIDLVVMIGQWCDHGVFSTCR